MSDNLIIEIQKAGDGCSLAMINGKLFTLLAGYEDHRAGGWFFLAVAGRTPLKNEDLDQHWQVVKSGQIYLALAQRPLSYHLAQGEGSEPPHGCDWPRLKTPPYHYTFIGPTQEAVEAQILLALEQFRPDLDPNEVLECAIRVPDESGRGPDALLVRM
jgi:hypothetical protein